MIVTVQVFEITSVSFSCYD